MYSTLGTDYGVYETDYGQTSCPTCYTDISDDAKCVELADFYQWASPGPTVHSNGNRPKGCYGILGESASDKYNPSLLFNTHATGATN